MNISRMMSQQVQQSEETMSSLGEWGPLEGLGRKPGSNFVWRCPSYIRLCLRLMHAGKTSTVPPGPAHLTLIAGSSMRSYI